MLFIRILGLLIFMMAVFMFGCIIRIIIKGECVTGEVCGISYSGPGASTYSIHVRFKKDKQYVESSSLNHFTLIPFFEKFQVSRLKRRHIGRQVHIYYNPNNKLQVFIREYMWKDLLLFAFLLCLGIILMSIPSLNM